MSFSIQCGAQSGGGVNAFHPSGLWRGELPGDAARDLDIESGSVVQIARGPKGERIRLMHDASGRLIEGQGN
jgi:hypothetical protein